MKTDYTDPRYAAACTTEYQSKVLATVIEHGTAQAPKVLGISERGLFYTLQRIRNQAVPLDAVPEGHTVKGVSTMVRPDGSTVVQWVKTSAHEEDQKRKIRAAVEGLAEDVTRIPSVALRFSECYNTDVIPWFNIGDAHLGMLAHSMEVGHNFDLKIAERELVAAMTYLIDTAPTTERCVIQDMGDFTHYENMAGVTDHSGHALDFDTRFNKMIKVYVRTMRFIVEYALEKFPNVDLIINQGNHSRTNDIWARVLFTTLYEENPRLNVLDNDSVFIGYRMGNTFVMSHHSDKCKPQRLIDVMATDFRQDFGECKYKYIDIGHIHHTMAKKEYGDVMIESFNNLAPVDKYAHDGGYRSRSFLTCVLRSKTYGEVGRTTVTVEQVKDNIENLAPGTTASQRRKVHTV